MGISEAIAIASLGLNVVVALVGMTWGLGRIRDSTQTAIHKEIIQIREKIDLDVDAMGRNIAEGMTAIREKIREVELFGRDTYMRRDSFYKTMELLSNDIKTQFHQLHNRLERMENKLDAQQET